jgi:hypothetical protein
MCHPAPQATCARMLIYTCFTQHWKLPGQWISSRHKWWQSIKNDCVYFPVPYSARRGPLCDGVVQCILGACARRSWALSSTLYSLQALKNLIKPVPNHSQCDWALVSATEMPLFCWWRDQHLQLAVSCPTTCPSPHARVSLCSDFNRNLVWHSQTSSF